MSREAFEPIVNGLGTCINKIKYLIKYYSWVSEFKDSLVPLLKQNNNWNEQAISNFLKEREANVKELELTLEIADNILREIENKNIDNPQYITYLNNELINFNWNQIFYLNYHDIESINNFEQSLKDNIPLTQQEFSTLSVIAYMVQNSNTYKIMLVQKISSINVFNKIHHIDSNIVMIGPNGSGKSTFARNFNGKLSNNNFTIISSQRLLVYNSPENINLKQNSIETVRYFQKQSKLGSDMGFADNIRDDFSNLILALFEEEAERERNYYNGTESKKESILMSTIGIWENLISHRKIEKKGRYDLIVKANDNVEYHFNFLSDGEKAIFYYIGHVLLAEPNSYIIIDEPENHLHLSICIALWDTLERKRQDCTFIYITHNLDFAVSRNNKTILWNKHFNPPFEWDVEEINSEQAIPEILLLEVLGSRRNIIFCEGDSRNSLDYKIYTKLFPEYNVIPVNGHDNVITYCKSFNQNKELSRLEAFGIVDGDAWSEEEIESLRKNNIMVLPFNEIENLICSKGILEQVSSIFASDPNAVEQFIEAFYRLVHSGKEKLASWYANNRINNFLKHNLFHEDKDIEKLKQEVSVIVTENKIQQFYESMLGRVNDDLAVNDYDNLIRYVNFKKELSKGLANKHIVSNYEERFIILLGSNEQFAEFIRKEYAEKLFPLLFTGVPN
ncbi:hypothetical protein A8L34_11010 [Bacillus sp. FJAT-27264]|uniref:DUF4435 domain-containing protein n=1 Tax=Paenibacillus sp. (strain DSM 101736 / FJAT-27264) TaxID=1850362 RepID=UPI000807EF87|nr:DUF4435 domain-containing protein [Bacillus sp. FJAT-27264]OBZ14460.1 hypothetical protein A8L34_11010 [Bacillus sp. FJAT-27264]